MLDQDNTAEIIDETPLQPKPEPKKVVIIEEISEDPEPSSESPLEIPPETPEEIEEIKEPENPPPEDRIKTLKLIQGKWTEVFLKASEIDQDHERNFLENQTPTF